VDYITKPFDPRELRRARRVALRTKRLLDLLPNPAGAPQAGESLDTRQLNAV